MQFATTMDSAYAVPERPPVKCARPIGAVIHVVPSLGRRLVERAEDIMTTIAIPTQTAIDAAVGSAICPLCHTGSRMTDAALRAGGYWRCSVCDQMWSAQRLATVAAYVAFAARHDAASRPACGSTI